MKIPSTFHHDKELQTRYHKVSTQLLSNLVTIGARCFGVKFVKTVDIRQAIKVQQNVESKNLVFGF